jgi:hypothetical protein
MFPFKALPVRRLSHRDPLDLLILIFYFVVVGTALVRYAFMIFHLSLISGTANAHDQHQHRRGG